MGGAVLLQLGLGSLWSYPFGYIISLITASWEGEGSALCHSSKMLQI